MSKTILFCPIHPTSLNKMLKIAALLNKIGAHCTFVVGTPYVTDNEKRILDQGFSIFHLENSVPLNNFLLINNFLLKKSACLSIYIKSFFLAFISEQDFPKHPDECKYNVLFRVLLHLKRSAYFIRLQENLRIETLAQIKGVKEIFSTLDIQSLVVAGDRHLSYEHLILVEAHKNNIEAYIPPISISGDPNDLARYKLKANAHHDVSMLPGLQKKWPQQCIVNEQGIVVSFHEFWKIKPLSDLGVLPEMPWLMGAGLSKKYMVSGLLDAQRHIKNGLNKEKIAITGDSDYDELFSEFQHKKENRNIISSKYSLNKNRKIAIVSLPPLYEHNLLPLDEHMDVIHQICSSLKKSETNVLISMHPKMNIQDYQFLEKQYSLSIIDEPLATVLHIADVFIASQGSSTWIWSVLCEIPAIICDWYGLNTNINDEKYGLKIVKKSTDMDHITNNIIHDKALYDSMVAQCQQAKGAVGKFDGKCHERITNIILDAQPN